MNGEQNHPSEETLLDIAKRNLKAADAIARELPSDDGLINNIGCNLQQAIELGLKHVLETSGIPYPFTHDIDDLTNLLPDDCKEMFSEIHQNAGNITKLEAKTRYTKGFRAALETVRTASRLAHQMVENIAEREARLTKEAEKEAKHIEKKFDKPEQQNTYNL